MMRVFIATSMVALLLVTALVSPVSASPQAPMEPFTLDRWGTGSPQLVEQQNYIVNRTGCPWDPDDNIFSATSGYLDPGQSVSGTGCVISDWEWHLFVLIAQTDKGGSNQFAVELDYQVGPHSFAVTNSYPLLITSPVRSFGSYYEIRQCLWSAYWGPSSEFGPIGDGTGVMGTISFKMTNTSSRRANYLLQGKVSSDLSNRDDALDANCDPGAVTSYNLSPVIDQNYPIVSWRP